MVLKVKKLSEDAMIPAYAHPGDAGMDLYSNERHMLKPGETALVHTGISVEIPSGTEAQIRPRSGLALKYSVTVLNTPGTLDEGYRGEVGVILINHGKTAFEVEKGMRIAQMVIHRVEHVGVVEVDELSHSVRGSGGFGSTGHGV